MKNFEHKWLKNADGTPLRCRQTGEIKFWKTSNRFVIPVKYGMYQSFYITNEGGSYRGKFLVANDFEWEEV